MTTESEGALDGLVVVELTTELWSTLAAALLGDFGARVIRVEDLSRPAPDPDRDGRHPREAFDADAELVLRNTRSVGLDLSDPVGRDVFERLLAVADVFVTDLAAQELEAQGWAYAQLAERNKRIVYVRGSGFGPTGPDRDQPALDELAAARAGVMPTLPQPGEPPVYTGSGPMYTAVFMALGAMVALRHRDATGEGQAVDASLLSGNLYANALTIDAYLAMRDDRLSEPVSRLDAGNPMSGASLAYPTSDGRWVTLTMPDSDRWWPAFSEVMGLDVDDPRYDTHDKRCGESRHEMMALLDDLFSRRPASHWRRQFDEKRLSADIIEKYEYAAGFDQAYLNRYILDLEHPSYGRFQSIGFPVHLSATPPRLGRMAPAVGQHSAEVLSELLGLSDDEIAELEQAKAVGSVRKPEATPRVSATPARSPQTVEAAESAESAVRPLDGIRVLDLTVWLQGPICSQHLADFGAEVIHVERPPYGDPARGVRSINAIPVAEWNQYFLVTNRNKKSIVVDLKTDEGRKIVHDLVAVSDVFLWNQDMGGLAKLGLDYETLSAINPRLVYATNSGYGHRGLNKPAFDMTVQALTGIMTRLGEPAQPPIYLGLGAGDVFGGLLSALGIMVALHHRDGSGAGQHVDASLLGSQLLLAGSPFQRYLATRRDFYSDQQSRRAARNPLWNRYQGKDRWLFLCAENTDENWARLCEVLGDEDLTADARFADAAGRADNAAELIELLDRVLAARDAGEWCERFVAAGLAAAPIQAFKDLAEDEGAWANDYFTRVHCDDAGREVELRGLPLTLSRTPGRVERLGPELGQDTELLLVDTLGYEWDDIARLKAAGAIP